MTVIKHKKPRMKKIVEKKFKVKIPESLKRKSKK